MVLASLPEDKQARPTVNLDLDELPIEGVGHSVEHQERCLPI